MATKRIASALRTAWLVAALISGAVTSSGTIAASMLSAPHSLRAEKDGFTRIALTRDYLDVPGTALVVHADRIKKRPAMIKRFIDGTTSR